MFDTSSHARLVIAPHIQRRLQPMIPRQIVRLALRDASGVVREPDRRRGRDELGRVEDAGHLFCVVGEGKWGKMWRRVGVCASGAFGCGEVVERLGFCVWRNGGAKER